ncbi:MAG: 1,2-phenylacetyl-CoA epoxidase subunit PaaC [Halieaceae bacterium]|jgi:ring-1,2-phenylacetyl-CoA epoxidase subunit PaaC|nr:1,2-phenylacetyl-CoA epoxidase subunit PaaC [Halieaceae bacterium]
MSDIRSREATRQYAIRLGDDALVLGHRLSEWCSNGPFLEEDLALTNVALDFIGRARMFYSYAAELAADGSSEDTYAYTRDCREFSNLLIHELPRGDFAFSMARQYLVDVHGLAYMEALRQSADETLAAIAEKAVKESRYHLRRSRDWVLRLGDGTPESHQRMQRALDELWGYTPELFAMDALEQELADAGIAVDAASLRSGWDRDVTATLAEATLQKPAGDWEVTGGRQGLHTESLGHMLSDLQFMQRAYPGLQW